MFDENVLVVPKTSDDACRRGLEKGGATGDVNATLNYRLSRLRMNRRSHIHLRLGDLIQNLVRVDLFPQRLLEGFSHVPHP